MFWNIYLITCHCCYYIDSQHLIWKHLINNITKLFVMAIFVGKKRNKGGDWKSVFPGQISNNILLL